MKLNPTLSLGAAFCLLAATSCSFMDTGSGGTQIHEPTVSDMATLEQQWGGKPRPSQARQFGPLPGYEPAPPQPQTATATTPAPGPATLPEPAPAPTPPQPAPPSAPAPTPPAPPQSAVTPAQIQKLKN